ncbi:MAG: hypothetical protein ACE5FS_01630 [Paracoccaceae bacterium]
MAGGFLAIAAGVGGRALFGLVLAGTVLRHLPSQESVAFFQLLLLQSVFINFTGGGGYVRGAAQGGCRRGAVRLLRSYLGAVGLTLAALAVAALPASVGFPGLRLPAQPWQIAVLLSAGTAASLAAHLQGILSGSTGVRRIFLPLAATYAAMAIALLLLPPVGLGVALCLLALSQSVPLVLLVASDRAARRLLCDTLRRRSGGATGAAPLQSMAVGTAAAFYLLVFYMFREVWAARVDADMAAAAFFIFRISETYFQVVSLALAGAPRLGPATFGLAGKGRAGIVAAMLGVACLAILQGAAILWTQTLTATLGVLAASAAMQLSCEALRVGTAVVSVIELRGGRNLRFLMLTAVPASLSGLAGIVLPVLSGPGGLFLFATLFSAAQVVMWLCLLLFERTRRLQSA